MENINNSDLMETINISNLIIIDALAESDYQTGRALEDDFLHIFSVERIKVNDEKELDNLLLHIKSCIYKCDSFSPILHFEGHGDEKHFYFPDNSHKEWGKLAECISCLNKLCDNKLLVYIASCHGIRFIHSNMHKSSLTHFAPCNTAIGPRKAISAEDLRDSTILFYKTLFSNDDLDSAINSLPQEVFEIFRSNQMFFNLMTTIYKQNFVGKGKKERYEYLLTEFKKQNNYKIFGDISSARKHVKKYASTPEEFNGFFHEYGKSYLGSNSTNRLWEIFKNLNKSNNM